MSSGSSISRAGYSSVDSLLASISASVSNEFRRNCESKDIEIQRLADLLAESEAACRELDSSLTQRETCISRLQDTLEKAEESRRDADEARKEVRSERDNAKQDRDDAKKERDSALRNLDRLTASSESLKIDLETARAERNSAVKMLHQSQLETEEWKGEAEKRGIEVTYLQRELVLWKEQARDTAKRNLAVNEEILQDLKEILQATRANSYNYQPQKPKIEDQQHFAPLTPASPSSRLVDSDDISSPSPVRTRGHNVVHGQQNAPIDSHAAIFSSSSDCHTAVAKTPKAPKTPKEESYIAFASTSTSAMKAKSKVQTTLSTASDYDSRNPSPAYSSVAPLLYPDPEPTSNRSSSSSSSAFNFHRIPRTRLLCRVNEHHFFIKTDEDEVGVDIKSEPEEDDDIQQLDELASAEGEAIETDEGQGLLDPDPRFQYVVQGFGASMRPGHSQMIPYAPARVEMLKSARDLFSQDTQENTQQQVTGSSGIEESTLKNRRKLPSLPTRQLASSKRRRVGDDEVSEDDEHEQRERERRRRLKMVKQRRKRSPSVSSEASSADELMITGSVHGSSSPSPRTPRSSNSNTIKKPAHTPLHGRVSREGDQGIKRKRK